MNTLRVNATWYALGTVGILALGASEGAAQVSLSVNRSDGSVFMVGEGAGINGYTIGSDNALLSPDNWNSLADQGVQGWFEANPRDQMLSELNPFGSIDLTDGAPMSLGHAYAGITSPPRDEDLNFQYSDASGNVIDGTVEYLGPINDLVLQIDPATGTGLLSLLSPTVGPYEVTGYSIFSDSASLSVDGFTGIGEEGWTIANPQATALSELNLTSSKFFSAGTSVSIGTVFVPGGEADFRFEFTTAAGDLLSGTVSYPCCAPCCADCNGNGIVDIGDANCVPDDQLDAFLAGLTPPSLRGDVDGDGVVQFSDFVVLSDNFGSPGEYTDGDFDKDGLVQFGDFVILSDNFGMSGGGGAAAAVPEPSSVTLLGLAGLLVVMRRCRC